MTAYTADRLGSKTRYAALPNERIVGPSEVQRERLSMIIVWEVDDGYAGPSRPQETHISDIDLEGLSEEDREAIIADIVDEDFAQRITWYEKERREG
jgi:hypothetical protein